MSGNCGKNSHSDAKPKEILSAGLMAHRQPPHTACQAFRSEKRAKHFCFHWSGYSKRK